MYMISHNEVIDQIKIAQHAQKFNYSPLYPNHIKITILKVPNHTHICGICRLKADKIQEVKFARYYFGTREKCGGGEGHARATRVLCPHVPTAD